MGILRVHVAFLAKETLPWWRGTATWGTETEEDDDGTDDDNKYVDTDDNKDDGEEPEDGDEDELVRGGCCPLTTVTAGA